MRKVYNFTKFKLIAGYLLIMIFGATAIIYIYTNTSLLNKDDGVEATTRQKLFLISNTVTKLFEAEGLSNVLYQSASDSESNSYAQLMSEVKQNMNTLRTLVSTSTQRLQIDTIKWLLDQKILNFNDLIDLRRINISTDFYERAVDALDKMRDSTESTEIQERTVHKLDTTIEEYKTKGFLGIFRRTKSRPIIEIVEEHVKDTLLKSNTYQADTIIHTMQSVLDEYQDKRVAVAKDLYRKEITSIRSGQLLTEQIKHILNTIQEEELSNTLHKMEERRQITKNLTWTLAGIAIIASILAFIFVVLIFSDISRSQRYRRELEEANRFTQRLLQSRERLMLTVSHDIKSPLNSITGYIELLNSTPLSERQIYYLSNMKSSSEHILGLAKNLLDYSKLESGKMEPEFVPYNPYNLLHEIAESFVPQATQKRLNIEKDISEALKVEVIGDPLKIRQIVVNLLSNAIKYTKKGKIELSASIPSKEKGQLVIVITDTGTGMSDDEQQLIFEEFTRLSAHHNDGAEGTGLGLTITKQLTELLGGSIQLSSKEGVGSTFTVKLPLVKSTDRGESTDSSEQTKKVVNQGVEDSMNLTETTISDIESDKNTTTVTDSPKIVNESDDTLVKEQHSSLKVLLVDDDPSQLNLGKELLTRKEISCSVTHDPRNAIEILSTNHFDLVMTDIQMPEMDGFELIRQIRNSTKDDISKIPVIALSARDDIAESYYLAAGFSGYLSKPYTSNNLFAAISKTTGYNFPQTKQGVSNDIESTPDNSSAKLFNRENNPLYDLSSIQIFADNDPESIRNIIESFCNDCIKNFKLMEEHLENREYEEIGKLAHKMLPMFKLLSIQSLVPLLSFLERTKPDSSSIEKIETTIDEITTTGQKIITSLSKEVKE